MDKMGNLPVLCNLPNHRAERNLSFEIVYKNTAMLKVKRDTSQQRSSLHGLTPEGGIKRMMYDSHLVFCAGDSIMQWCCARRFVG